jgi:hypothetical protein
MKKKVTIVLITGFLMAVVGINIFRWRQVESATAWANRLRLIESAKHQWVFENNKHTNDIPTWSDISYYIPQPSEIFSNFSYANGRLVSPAGEAYTIGRVDELPTCYKDGRIFKLQ